MKNGSAGPEQVVAAANQQTAPASHVRYYVLAFACALAVVTYIQRLGFGVGTPAIMKSLGFNNAQMADLAAAFLVAYGLFQVPGGLLGDRLGGRHVLTILVLGWSLLTAAVALAKLLPPVVALQFGFLLVLRFLFGAFQAGGFPVLGRIMADWMPIGERGFAQGSIWMISRVGGALIPFLFAGFLAWSGDWPLPFVLIGGLGVLWCGAFWPWFRNRPEEMAQVDRPEREFISAGRPALRDQPRSVPWSRMVRSLSVWSLCLMYGCTGFSGNFFTGLLPLYLTKHRPRTYDAVGLTHHLIFPTGCCDDALVLAQQAAAMVEYVETREGTTVLSALPLAGGAVACLLGGAASDWLIRRFGNRKWGRRAVGAFGLTLAGVALLCTLWAGQPWLLGLLLTTAFFCNDLSMGPAWASCADIGERYAGTLSGAMNMIGALFGACALSLTGRLWDHGLPELVFIIFAAVYWLAALCWFGVDVTKRLTDAP